MMSQGRKAQNNPIIRRRRSTYMVHGSMNNIGTEKHREQVAVFAYE